MFNPSRNQVRGFFFQAWARFGRGLPLSDMEARAVQHIARHPEYHPILDQPERYQTREWPPELGETNPFLHLAMHVTLTEQLAIDQPAGVRDAHRQLLARLGDEHAVEHAMMDCLGEMLWHAQRAQAAPDGAAYLDCLLHKARGA